MNKKYALILAVLVAGLIASDVFIFNSLGEKPVRESVIVARVIDGDTLKLDDGRTIRLLNVNTPEKGMPNAELSANLLKSFEKKEVEIETAGEDKYNRWLARIYTPDYLNLELVEQGLSSKFLVQESENKAFAKAEEEAIKNSLGIWQKSGYFGCFESEIEQHEEIVFLKNKCEAINMNGWLLKDESRKTYLFNMTLSKAEEITLHSGKGKDNSTDLFWGSDANIWNNDKDSLYLFEQSGRIAHYESYGY